MSFNDSSADAAHILDPPKTPKNKLPLPWRSLFLDWQGTSFDLTILCHIRVLLVHRVQVSLHEAMCAASRTVLIGGASIVLCRLIFEIVASSTERQKRILQCGLKMNALTLISCINNSRGRRVYLYTQAESTLWEKIIDHHRQSRGWLMIFCRSWVELSFDASQRCRTKSLVNSV